MQRCLESPLRSGKVYPRFIGRSASSQKSENKRKRCLYEQCCWPLFSLAGAYPDHRIYNDERKEQMMRKMISTLAATAMILPMLAAAPALARDHRYDDRNYDSRDYRSDRYDSRYDARYDDRRYDDRYDARYDQRPREWRGSDGRTYCRKSDGTVGLIVGGAAGALLGRAVDTRGERTTGTILGAAAGALIGKSLASKRRCR